ncbi:MAG: hypothetical protein HYU30_08355 [Chloroflexi bacterium]|nr:hypothetical protein [Chloroflexota bacterium]
MAQENPRRYGIYFSDYGVKALKIDATDIAASIGTPFDNIYAQGLSPLMERSEGDARNRMTYASMHAVLRPKGRVIMVQSAYRTSKSGRKLYLSLREQLAIVDSMKLFQVVKVFNHMIIPPGFYSYYNRRILNWIDFNIGGVIPFRHIIILEKI